MALEVYLSDGGRNVLRTLRLLNAEPYNLPVKRSTVMDWRRGDRWDDEGERRARAVLPLLGDLLPAYALQLVDRGLGALAADLDNPATTVRDRVAIVRLAAEIGGVIGKSPQSLALLLNQQLLPGPVPGGPSVPAALSSVPRLALSASVVDSLSDRLASVAALSRSSRLPSDGEGSASS